MKKLNPGTVETLELNNKIAQILMDFVSHNHKPFSKTLQKFIAHGAHDLRADLVAVKILHLVKDYLEEDKKENKDA